MPAPTTSDAFLDLVRKSGVVDEKRLDAYLRKVPAGRLPAEANRLAGALVRDGILTQFQAEQFLQGKWRRFTIGKYKVLERIGSGGMGSVYLCEHKFMRRRAAVKILPTAKARDPSALERFYREARAVAALDHPNIVRAYDIDHEEGLHFLVMEYVDGASLQDIVRKSGPLDPIRAAHYISQGALGLQHAYEVAALVHRDIKPGNLIVDRSGTVKILDMGLARFFNDEDDLLTKKYDENVLGTADYLAPEQALDSHGVDIRADIYSLGATFYFCLTGRTPFSEGTVAQKLIWHQTRQPKSIRAIRPEVPEGLVAVVEQMMAKDPSQRYQTPQAVVQALAPWTQSTIAPPSDTEMPRLSPAVTGMISAEGEPAPASPPPSKPSSSKLRKVWQVATSPAPQTPPSGTAPPEPPAAPAESASPAPARPEAPAPKPKPPAAPARRRPEELAPQPGNNGALVQPAPAEEVPDEDGLRWDNLTAATKDTSVQAGTERRAGKKPPSGRLAARKARPATASERRLWWVIGIVTGVVLLLALLVLLWVLMGGEAPSPQAQRPARSTELLVSATSPLARYRTIREVLHDLNQQQRLRAVKDVHIMVLDDFIEEPEVDLADMENVTLESRSPTGRTTWRWSKGADPRTKMLFVNNLEGGLVRGFDFDGEGGVEEIILLAGNCPGFRLEDVSLRGFKKQAIRVANCAGTAERPVTLAGLTASTDAKRELLILSVSAVGLLGAALGQGSFLAVSALLPAKTRKEGAIVFDLFPFYKLQSNRHIIVQDDCHFEGPYESPVRIAKAAETATKEDVTIPPDLLKPGPDPLAPAPAAVSK